MLVLVQHHPSVASEPKRGTQLQAITPTSAEDDAESAKRLSVCKTYRDGDGSGQASHPFWYVGNPKQYTKPLGAHEAKPRRSAWLDKATWCGLRQ